MNPGVSILSNVNLLGSFNFGASLAEFPQDPSPGVFVVKDHKLFVFISIGTYQTWYPLTPDTRYYIHNQSAPATRWTITHNLDCASAWFQPQDSSGNLMNDYVVFEDVNNRFIIDFPTARAGTSIVIAPAGQDVPEIIATHANFGRGKVTADESGLMVDGLPVAKLQEVQTLISALDTSLRSVITEGDTANATAFEAALNSLQSSLNASLAQEASARSQADSTLQASLSSLSSQFASHGHSFASLSDKPNSLSGFGISDAYTKTEADTLLGGKANKATSLAGYGITDAYTKAQTDLSMAQKADKATTLAGYNIANAYTKPEVDALLAAGVPTHVIGARASGSIAAIAATTQIPLDNTVPIITEGTEIWTSTVTPQSATSTLSIQASFTVEYNNSREIIAALFEDSVCIGATIVYLNAGKSSPCSITVSKVTGNTSARTYSMRVGLSASASWYVNKKSSGADLGGALATSGYSILEII